jgi:PPIC-type PPIASE domain
MRKQSGTGFRWWRRRKRNESSGNPQLITFEKFTNLKHAFFILLFSFAAMFAFAQPLATIKKELETTPDPFGYVKFKLKKKFKVDTVAVVSSTSFLGIADSIAYKGKLGKVYGPFKGNKILLKVLAKLPNTFYHVSHILLDTGIYKPAFADSLAGNIISRIKNGTSSFESLAATYSADNASAYKSGDLGWFVRGVMLPQLDNAIASHKKGELFKVWTEAGLHIVTVKDSPKKDDGYALLLRVIL